MKNDEVTTLSVEVAFHGKAKGQFDGGIIKENMHEITVKGYPVDLPDKLMVDVSELEIGDNIHVGDLAKNYKFEFLQEDHDKILVSCGHPRVQKLMRQKRLQSQWMRLKFLRQIRLTQKQHKLTKNLS